MKAAEYVHDMVVKELHHEDVNTRINGILRYSIYPMLNKAVRHFYGMADTLKQLQKNFKGNDIHGHHPMQYIENIVNLYLGT